MLDQFQSVSFKWLDDISKEPVFCFVFFSERHGEKSVSSLYREEESSSRHPFTSHWPELCHRPMPDPVTGKGTGISRADLGKSRFTSWGWKICSSFL